MSKGTFSKGNVVGLIDTYYGGEGRGRLIWRSTTYEERNAWYADPANKGMGEDGETKLAPNSTSRYPAMGEMFRVVRARVAAPYGYSTIPGCVLIEDANGTHWYAKKENLS